jgi:hypothetical protein
MPRTLGRTSLGRTIDSKSAHADYDKPKIARAIILRPYNDLYVFYMGLLNENNQIVMETRPIRLIGTQDQLAAQYGPPSELSRGSGSAWSVIIHYSGASVNNGFATIQGRVYENTAGEYEATKSANELLAKGTSWAPPGSGMM